MHQSSPKDVYRFDLWDSIEKKLYKDLNQQDLPGVSDLLIEATSHLIHYIGMRAYNGREMRHGDLVRKRNEKTVYVIAWDPPSYVLRNKDTVKAIFQPELYEVLDNKFEQL